MPLLFMGLAGVSLLALGFIFYGRFLERVFGINPNTPTPAQTMRDGIDFIPTRPVMLLGQHFAAIAAVGPIAGPILAASKWGWPLAFLWVVFGAIFIGAVHDFSAMIASVRHGAKSIAEVVGIHVHPLAKKIFLVYIWFTLIYVVIVFTDLTATAFISRPDLGNENFGPGVATSSILYLALAAVLGLVLYRTRVKLLAPTIIGIALLLVFIRLGQGFPLVASLKTWQIFILGYCFMASVIPLWVLLQPRGYLGGFLLYASLMAGVLGFLFYRQSAASMPVSFDVHAQAFPLGVGFFPLLFTTIACGACSGFHGLVASGTTSKQIAVEPHCRIVGYGGMLLEAFVALVALATAIIVFGQGGGSLSPDEIYARGLATFLKIVGIPFAMGVAFGKLAFATFIYDTLDVATRLGRYIFQEFFELKGMMGRCVAAMATLAIPAFVLLSAKEGSPPAWKAYWGLFGASNQLLACLTLAAITVWLKKEKRKWWVTGIPCLFMAVVTLTSLWIINKNAFSVVGMLLFLLAGIFLLMAGWAFFASTRITLEYNSNKHE